MTSLISLVTLIGMIESPSGDFVTLVRQGYLDINPYANFGLVFDNYRWFDERSWGQIEDKDGIWVVVSGTGDDKKAVDAFHEANQYQFKLAFKAMQLKPVYQLTEDKSKIGFLIRFRILEGKSFEVHSGRLLIYSKNGKEKREVPLSDKALLSVIEGIYANQNPYVSLIKGLPYK